MKHFFKLFTLLLALSLLSYPALAETISKIAVIDAPGVINKTKAAENAREILRIKTTEAQTKINTMEKELTALKGTLEKKRAVMSKEKFSEAQLKLSQQVREFRNKAQNIQENLDRQNVLLKKEITDALTKVVAEIAKEKGYEIVVAKHLLLFADKNIEISDEVLRRVNKLLAKKSKK